MTRVVLFGYYGELNAGDDAFTVVCSDYLLRFGARRVGVLADTLPQVPCFVGSALLLHRRWRGVAERVENARIRLWGALGASVIVGGGSIFRDRSGLRELRGILDRSPKGRHAAVGVSIGPYRDDGAQRLLAELLPRFCFVGVRDKVSLERVRETAPDARVKLTFDLGPLLPGVRGSAIGGIPPEDRRGLGISLRGDQVGDSDLNLLAKGLARTLDQGLADRLVLLSLNSHPWKGDAEIHRALAARVNRPESVEIVEHDGNPFAMWDRVGRLRAMVAMRLHAAVFAHGNAVPTFIVPYEEKNLEWGDMSGHPESMIGTLSDAVDYGLPLLLGEAPPMPTLTPEESVERALANFAWLDSSPGRGSPSSNDRA